MASYTILENTSYLFITSGAWVRCDSVTPTTIQVFVCVCQDATTNKGTMSASDGNQEEAVDWVYLHPRLRVLLQGSMLV